MIRELMEGVKMSNKNYDIIIIGGGVMGCSSAYHLMSLDEKLRVAVVEMDPSYTNASTTLSWGNVRIHFSLKENIQISQYAMEVLERFEEDMAVDGEKPFISWHREGNLFLTDEKGVQTAKDAFVLQKSLGCQIDWWSASEVNNHYPLYDMSGLVGGSFSPTEGYLDGYTLLMGYKTRARSLGTKFIHDEVVAVSQSAKQVNGVKLASGEEIKAGFVINCAGAWAGKVALTAGIKLPIAPTKRQVFAVAPAVKPRSPLPLTVLPSGFCFRNETGNLILVGKGMLEDSIGFDFTWDKKRFTDILWPELAQFVPAFDTLKLVRGWAGLYDINTLDGNAILGQWPELRGLFLANGFSGHGLQQAPAVGRYLSELILGKPTSLDLSIFRPERILENKPITELGLV
jgi:glycine/D-amino acid oxidase-like deaminating enzyme